MIVKENCSIRDLNRAYPIYCKSEADVEFVQMNISFTMTKEAFETLDSFGYDFVKNTKDSIKEVYFDVMRCKFDTDDVE